MVDAHYKAVNIDNNQGISPVDIEDWASGELADHAWLGGAGYVNSVIWAYIFGGWQGCRLVWSCDLDESEQFGHYYDQSDKDYSKDFSKAYRYQPVLEDAILINIDKEEYVGLFEYKIKNNHRKNDTYLIHPLPILTCATNEYQGGGDFDYDGEFRGHWAGDRLAIGTLEQDIPFGFKNISDIHIPVGDMWGLDLQPDKMALKSLQSTSVKRLIDKKSEFKNLSKEDDRESKWSITVLDLILKSNNNTKISFEKSNGDVVVRNGKWVGKKNGDSGVSDCGKYYRFFDNDAKKEKSFIIENFQYARAEFEIPKGRI